MVFLKREQGKHEKVRQDSVELLIYLNVSPLELLSQIPQAGVLEAGGPRLGAHVVRFGEGPLLAADCQLLTGSTQGRRGKPALKSLLSRGMDL